MTTPLTTDEFKKLVETRTHKKRRHVADLIGRNDFPHDDWLAVLAERRLNSEREERLNRLRVARRERRFVAPPIPAFERLRMRREDIARQQRHRADIERLRREREELAAIRETLMRFARIARGMKMQVRSSTLAGGRISSYYIEIPGQRPIRVSDHALPWTPDRQAKADTYGGSPFLADIIIDKPISDTRIRRLLVLATHGRL